MAAAYTCLAVDFRTRLVKEEVPFSDLTYGRTLSRAGSLSAKIPHDHPKATPDILDPDSTLLYILRGDVIVWSGFLATVRKSKQQGMLDLGGLSWWWLMSRRKIRWDATYAQVDQLDIARDILTRTFAVPGGNTGWVLDTNDSGVLRDRAYNAFEIKKVHTAIQELGDVENGFDFRLDSNYESGVIVERMRFGYPSLGTRTNLVFELGGNCEAVSWARDGTSKTNLFDAVGAGEGADMLIRTAQAPADLGHYPLLEDDNAWKDVSDPDTLNHHALAALAARRNVLGITDIDVRTTTDVPVGTWTMGDEVTLQGTDGFLSLDGRFRILADEIKVSNEGNEVATISFVDTGAFNA